MNICAIDTNVEVRMNWSRSSVLDEWIIGLFRFYIVFSVVYYGYLYLFPFHQGVSSAPDSIKAVKDVVHATVFLSLCALLLRSIRSKSLPPAALLFIPFLFAIAITSIIHSAHTGLRVQLWENIKNIAVYIPVYSMPFLMKPLTLDRLARDFFQLIPTLALIQCMFVFFYHGAGYSLWADGVYAGWLGNPNSFALFLNLSVACILSTLPSAGFLRSIYTYFAIAVFSVAILKTESGSQFVISCFILVFAAAARLEYWRRYVAAILMFGSVVLASSAELDRTLFSLKGAFSSDANMEAIELSDSVTGRRQDWNRTLEVFSKGPESVLFGDFQTLTYKAMDGQYLVLMYNGGLLALLTFLVPAGCVYLKSVLRAWTARNDFVLGMSLMIAAFGISFLASRVLMYFPFNFFFFLVSGMVMAVVTGGRDLRRPEF